MAKTTEKKDSLMADLNDIKRLLILQMLKQGTTQKEIANALKMDAGNFSRWFPVTKIISKGNK